MKKCIWLAMNVACCCWICTDVSAQVTPNKARSNFNPGVQGAGGQTLPGVQIPGQFPQGFVPGGQGMGAQSLPPGFTPTVPVNQILQMRMLQGLGSNRGPQYGPAGNNTGGYNPNYVPATTTTQQNPEQAKKDERRMKIKERADLKRAKEKDLAEQRKAKAQEAKANAAPAKAAEEKK